MAFVPVVFISYCREDKEYKDELRRYLRPLEKQRRLSVWDDSLIASGEEWPRKIEEAIKTSHIAILLLSMNFFSSTFITDVEVPLMREGYEQNKLDLLPVLSHVCLTDEVAWLKNIQIWKYDEKPVWKLDSDKKELALLQLTRDVSVRAGQVAEEFERKERGRLPLPTEPPIIPVPVVEPPQGTAPKTVVEPPLKAEPPAKWPRLLTPKKLLFYIATLLVLLACFWSYTFVLVHSDYDNVKNPVTVPPLSIYIRSKKYLSPGDATTIGFQLKNQSGGDHYARIKLDELGKGNVNIVGSDVVHDGLVKGGGADQSAVTVHLPFSYANYAAPELAGLGLEGKVDSNSFERRGLQLYISPLPKIMLLEKYCRIATGIMWLIFFGSFCFWTFWSFFASSSKST